VSDRFRSIADALGVDVEITHYPDGTRTAADAARAIGCELGAIVKSLVFVVDGAGPVLALTSGANRVDVTKLGGLFGGVARQATPDEARDATGFAIGGTPPFGASLPTVIDEALLQYETVWAAAGTPDTCFPITPQRLIEVTTAQVAQFATR
jgi:prolyl-tRNA editing enzyme YbaK/EbsC (Cys-tRNA(Pro) deacylase)